VDAMDVVAVSAPSKIGFELKNINQKIKNILKDNEIITVTDCDGLNGIASGLKQGKVIINGSTGDYAGTLNSGAQLIIKGNVGRFTGDNMISGEILVKGNAGYCTAPYCYGGKVIISGTCGDFLGTMNKGATILVEKDVGNDLGTYMLAGNIILLGNAGEQVGNFLIAGQIFIRGKWKSLGNNTKIDDLTFKDTKFLQQLFSAYKLEVRPEEFTKIVAKTDKPFYAKKVKI
jgi:glutamate synthase domain-containing protein 3